MFHSGDLSSGIGLAVQQRKAVLCFVHDDSQQSNEWEHVLTTGSLAVTTISPQAVMLKIQAGSTEAALLNPFCAINSIPAIIVIKNGSLQANLQTNDIDTAQIQSRLEALFGPSTDNAPAPVHQEPVSAAEQLAAPLQTPAPSLSTSSSTPTPTFYLTLPPSEGQFRLPNNAYDALREHTQQLLDQNTPHQDIYQTQLRLLDRLPILRDEVRRLRSITANPALSDYAREKLLRMPAAAVKAQAKVEASSSTASTAQPQSPPPGGQHLANSSSSQNRGAEYVYIQPDSNQLLSETEEQSRREAEAVKKRAERATWNRQQRERQQQDRAARDRIKAEIAADREERRRLAELRGQNGQAIHAGADPEVKRIKTEPQTVTGSLRVQVRSFDGSVLRGTFKHDSTISGDIRPFVDERTGGSVPYNLKLILTPLPNRNIEAAEEDAALSDLGIKSSCTFVMVPVRGYVDSYSENSGAALVRRFLGMGYGVASGAAETVWGVGRYVLGYNSANQAPADDHVARQAHEEGNTDNASSTKVRVRTLADQRAEENDSKRGAKGQLYNGNQLNFEPNRDDDDTSKRD